MNTSMKHRKPPRTLLDKRAREEMRIGFLAIKLQRMIRMFAFGDEPRPLKSNQSKIKSVPRITGNLSHKKKQVFI
jgi:hypothetical protein